MKYRKQIEGIEYDINVRWEKGIPHHTKSKETFNMLKEMDWHYGNDYFRWKSGGDGDNGETIMFEMDIYFEEQDMLKREHTNS